ncbi:MAG: tRNA (adenosine(37)-N6)-threonylcarbamoyltransferase complex ATPase subunit type 1 TsaE [Candidatus Aminicenantales bacterium]
MPKKAASPRAGRRTVTTRSEEETFRLAEHLASGFSGKEIVLLSGELGAGKTVFAKGIAAGAGVRNVHEVCSPSFTLVNVYEGKHRIFHIDLYRLDREAEILDLGWEDYLGEGIVIVEWAEKLIPLPDGISVRIEAGPGDERRVTIRRP